MGQMGLSFDRFSVNARLRLCSAFAVGKKKGKLRQSANKVLIVLLGRIEAFGENENNTLRLRKNVGE